MPYFDALSNTGYKIIRVEAEDENAARHQVNEYLRELSKQGRYFDDWQIKTVTDPTEVAIEDAKRRHRVDFQTSIANGAKIKEVGKQRVNQGFLIYDPYNNAPDLIFIENLQEELSSHFPVENSKITRHVLRQESPFGPREVAYLQIALIFISTTLATGFLAKIGEDIWDKLKEKAQEAQKRDSRIQDSRSHKTKFLFDFYHHLMGITITIKADKVFVQGHAYVKDYETLVKALSMAQQMISDAESKLADGIDKIKANEQVYREYEGLVKDNPLFEDGLWFEYEYSPDRQKWSLQQIANYKKSTGTDELFVKGKSWDGSPFN